MSKRKKWVLCRSCVLVGLLGAPAWANNFTVDVIAKDDKVTGADTVIVEVFVRNTSGVDQPFVAAQLNFPCGLHRQPGATGFIGLGKCGTAAACSIAGTPCFSSADCPAPQSCNVVAGSTGTNCNEDSDCPVAGETCFASEALLVAGPEAVVSGNEATSVNGIPRLFDADDIAATNQMICQVAITSFPAMTSSTLPAGATRYIGAMRYRVSDCATGGFTARLEGFVDPKAPSALNATRFRPTSTTLHPWTYGGDDKVTINVGTCCEGTTCKVEGVNEYCCENGLTGFPNATAYNEGETCASPTACACQNDAQCDDGSFCNGCETCNLATGQCQPGTPPVCADGADAQCTTGKCVDNAPTPGTCPSGAPQSGGCVVNNDPDGQSCSIGGERNPQCDLPDTCLGGTCRENLVPGGAPCAKDPKPSGECNLPDTCDGAGNCSLNYRPDGAQCTDDGNQCTDDVCQGGNCAHPNDDTNACSDGLNCTSGDRCVGGNCSGTPRDCDDGDGCTHDTCVETPGACPDAAKGGYDAATGCCNDDVGNDACDTDADCEDTVPGAVCTDDPVPGDGVAEGVCACNPCVGFLNNYGTCQFNNDCPGVCSNNLKASCTANRNAAGACPQNETCCPNGDTCDFVLECRGGGCVKTCDDGNACTVNDVCYSANGDNADSACNGKPACPSDGKLCTNDVCTPSRCCDNQSPPGTCAPISGQSGYCDIGPNAGAFCQSDADCFGCEYVPKPNCDEQPDLTLDVKGGKYKNENCFDAGEACDHDQDCKVCGDSSGIPNVPDTLSDIPCETPEDCEKAGSQFTECISFAGACSNGWCRQGNEVVVNITLGGLNLPDAHEDETLNIAGGQFRIEYDPTCLAFQEANPSETIACDSADDCPGGVCTPKAQGSVSGYCTGSGYPSDPWVVELFEQVDEVNGVICYAVSVPPVAGGDKGAQEGTMARLTFTKIGKCNACDVCLTSVNPCNTRLTTSKGDLIEPKKLDCSKEILDNDPTTVEFPGDLEVNSDCDAAGADIAWDKPVMVDKCDGTNPLQCTCTHTPILQCVTEGGKIGDTCQKGKKFEGDECVVEYLGKNLKGTCVPKFDAIDCNPLLNAGGFFPQGRYDFQCDIEHDPDKNSCGDVFVPDDPDTKDVDESKAPVKKIRWTVNVSDHQSVDVHVQLSPIVQNKEFKRCICFELFSSCTPKVVEEHCETLTFGGPGQFAGQTISKVKVKKGKYVCITARDRQHSLRSVFQPLVCNTATNQYEAEFRADPFFGGNWLIQGNLNRDRVIDILDFGVFLGQLNQNPTPKQDKLCEDNAGQGYTHADLNGDGQVDVADFTFIQINFLEHDKGSCCPGQEGAAADDLEGLTSISVKDLRRMGLGDLAIADLNGDGFVDTDDMAAYLAGARPGDVGKGRGASGRGTIRR